MKRETATVTKTFRLPRDLARVLVADSQERNASATDLLVSILTRYAAFDRKAEKFGFVTLSKNFFRALLDAIPEERIQEIAASQSVYIEEFMEFWYEKKDLKSVLKTVDVMSKYLRSFEFTTSQSGHELTISMRTDLGRKFAIFLGTAWEKGITRTLGVAPKVEVEENQVILTLKLDDDLKGQ